MNRSKTAAIALIGAELTRAESIEFTAAHVEIEATYFVPENSPFTSVDDVDREGVRIIAVSANRAVREHRCLAVGIVAGDDPADVALHQIRHSP